MTAGDELRFTISCECLDVDESARAAPTEVRTSVGPAQPRKASALFTEEYYLFS